MNWIKNKENIFLNSKQSECIKEFIKFSIEKNLNELKNLQKKIEKDYKIIDESFYFKEINEEAFRFPMFKEDGKLEEIDFSEDQISNINDNSNNKANSNIICSLI